MEAGRRLRDVTSLAAALSLLLAAPLPLRAQSAARDLTLQSLDGASIRPFATTARAWVFVFTRTDCPIAARYAPALQRLQRQVRSSHVTFELVFVDPAEKPAALRAYLSEYGYAAEALRDPDHRLVQAAGATTTPEAAVFVASASGGEPRLVYRGRIDDRYVDLAHMRPQPTQHDLEDVLAAIEDGARVEFRSTPAVGCLIADVTR